jgi:hypothetical protein
MASMKMIGMPLPRALREAVEYTLNADLHEVMENLPIDEGRYTATRDEIRKWSAKVDAEHLGYIGSRQLASLADKLVDNPLDLKTMQEMKALLLKYKELGVPLNLWYSQNAIYEIGLQQFSIRGYLAERGDPSSRTWVDEFEALCDHLGVTIQ